MVEADLEQIRQRRIGRNVSAKFWMLTIGSRHHRQGIPTHQRGDPRLYFGVTWELWLIGQRNRIAVRGIDDRRQRYSQTSSLFGQFHQNEGGTIRAFSFDDLNQ